MEAFLLGLTKTYALIFGLLLLLPVKIKSQASTTVKGEMLGSSGYESGDARVAELVLATNAPKRREIAIMAATSRNLFKRNSLLIICVFFDLLSYFFFFGFCAGGGVASSFFMLMNFVIEPISSALHFLAARNSFAEMVTLLTPLISTSASSSSFSFS